MEDYSVPLDTLHNAIATGSREPFKDILAGLLNARPELNELIQFARRNPEKWSKMVETFAKLSDYQDQGDTNIFNVILTSSDSALYQRALKLQEELWPDSQTTLPEKAVSLPNLKPEEKP